MVRGVFGQGGPDGDLVFVVPVEGLAAERGQEGFFDPVGGVGEDAGGVGQQVEQGGIVVGSGGCVQVCELGLGAGALGVQVGGAGADACPVGLDGGVGRVGGLF